MTTVGDLLGEQADMLARETIGIGDVHILPLTPKEGITPKNGKPARNKYLIVLGFDNDGNMIGGVVINSHINYNLPPSITDYLMPVTVSQCSFLSYDSFINCSHLVVVKKDKFNSKTFVGKIDDDDLLSMIVGTIIESPQVSKQQLKEFGIAKE